MLLSIKIGSPAKIKPNRIISTGNFGTMNEYRFFKSLNVTATEDKIYYKNDGKSML